MIKPSDPVCVKKKKRKKREASHGVVDFRSRPRKHGMELAV